ncbi:MAG: hypothetical protein K6A42_07110 [Treponema sp.]|nr:hypothetical protein [Treponema sp.]
MNKKKCMITLAIIAPLALAASLAIEHSINPNFLNDLTATLLLGLFCSSLVFISLIIFFKLKKILGFKIESYKPYLYLSAITFFITGIFIILIFGKDKSGAIKCSPKEISLILLTLFYACIYTFFFIFDVDDKRKVILYKDFFLKNLKANRPNKDNSPVTINTLRLPEEHFENQEYKEIFLKHCKQLKFFIEKEAKDLIFQNDLQYETTGEWFLSRVDFLDGDDYSPRLCLYMTFINKKIIEYKINGLVPLSEKTIQNDFCRINFTFHYRPSNSENIFEFEESWIEFL